MEIYNDLTIHGHVEVLRWNLDDEVAHDRFCRFHVPEMEPPYLPLLFKDVTQGQHELPMLIVVGQSSDRSQTDTSVFGLQHQGLTC